MSVKVTNNMPTVLNERNNKISLAFRLMLEAVHRYSIPNTPKQHGNLRADVVKAVNGLHGSITWDKNYALYQEAGITHGTIMRNYTTPGTGPHFARKAVDRVVNTSSAYFRQVGL
jgi:hypothetical protein